MGKDGSPIEMVKWPVYANLDTTWKRLTYSIMATIKKAKKDLPIDYTTAIFALQPNKTNPLQEEFINRKNVNNHSTRFSQYFITQIKTSKENPEGFIFDVKDHIDPQMLANKVEQDLFEYNPQAKQLARDSRKVQMKRSRCAQAAQLRGLAQRNISAINANMVPSDDQTITGM